MNLVVIVNLRPFICTKEALVQKSLGLILNNMHILSWDTTGGTHLEDGRSTVQQSEYVWLVAVFLFFSIKSIVITIDRGIVVNKGL